MGLHAVRTRPDLPTLDELHFSCALCPFVRPARETESEPPRAGQAHRIATTERRDPPQAKACLVALAQPLSFRIRHREAVPAEQGLASFQGAPTSTGEQAVPGASGFQKSPVRSCPSAFPDPSSLGQRSLPLCAADRQGAQPEFRLARQLRAQTSKQKQAQPAHWNSPPVDLIGSIEDGCSGVQERDTHCGFRGCAPN